jgi:L-iditol 2-dehydrogenase
MLALRIAELEKLEVVDIPRPQVAATDLLLRVASAGICGTDSHILHGAYPVDFPLIPGHEYAGVVEAIGDDVKDFRLGDHVVVDPIIGCSVCFFCRRGKSNLCKNLKCLGANVPGGFAEYSLVPARQAYKLPESLSLAHAVLTEPLACCLHAVDLSGLTSGDRVVIFGAGPMGVLVLQLAQLHGASEIQVVEPQEGRRRRVTNLGASGVVDTGRESPVDEIRRRFPEGAEVVFECSGNINALRHATNVVMRGGTIIVQGVCKQEDHLELNPFWATDSEVTIRGTSANPGKTCRAIDLLASGRIDAEAVVTHRFSLKDAEKAYRCAGSSESLKVVIEP